MKLRKRKHKNKVIFSIIFALILCLSVGSATISNFFNIGGISFAKKGVWDLDVTNIAVDSNSTATINSINFDTDNIECHFGATLNSLTDYYSFTFMIENNGTIDAKLNNFSIGGLAVGDADYLEYNLTYADGSSILTNDGIEAGTSEIIVVLVKYYSTSSITSGTYKLSFNFDYGTSDGNIRRLKTLYKAFERESKFNTIALKYTDSVDDTIDGTGNEDVYYYYADEVESEAGREIREKNNVLFGGYCWQMYRTTKTGGIKMIFNGKPNIANQCGNDRGTHTDVDSVLIVPLDSNYAYGTEYTYNSSTGFYSLGGTITNETWGPSTYIGIIGKYTCMSGSYTNCSSLYRVGEYVSSTEAMVASYSSSIPYGTIGKMYYGSHFNSSISYTSDFGYMYNGEYPSGIYSMDGQIMTSFTLDTTQYFANSATFSGSSYTLDNPYLVGASDAANLVGKYTLHSNVANSTSTNLYYIFAYDNGHLYEAQINNGDSPNAYNYTLLYGDSYTDNGDNTYTLSNTSTMQLFDLINNGYLMKGKYFCIDFANSGICSGHLLYMGDYHDGTMYYNSKDTYTKYSGGFSYNSDTGLYTLDDGDSVTIWDWSSPSGIAALTDHNYTCMNLTGECSTLYYGFMIDDGAVSYYALEDGHDVFYPNNTNLYASDVNSKDSIIKKFIDQWYYENLSSYSSSIDSSTVYCNNRNLNQNDPLVLDGIISNVVTFQPPDLTCPSTYDMFSSSNEYATLNFPIGMITYGEYNLSKAAIVSYGATSYDFWTMTPDSYSTSSQKLFSNIYVGSSGTNIIEHRSIPSNEAVYVRPVITLPAGTKAVSGTGSTTLPYVIQ